MTMTLAEELRASMDELSLLVERADLDQEKTIEVLCAIRDCRADLAIVAGELEQKFLATNPARRFQTPLGEVEIKKAKRYTHWDDEGLMKVVVARALDERAMDPETGEMLEPGWQTVARVISECARPSWRLTPLRARGIDESEFCEVQEDGLSMRLPPRQN